MVPQNSHHGSQYTRDNSQGLWGAPLDEGVARLTRKRHQYSPILFQYKSLFDPITCDYGSCVGYIWTYVPRHSPVNFSPYMSQSPSCTCPCVQLTCQYNFLYVPLTFKYKPRVSHSPTSTSRYVSHSPACTSPSGSHWTSTISPYVPQSSSLLTLMCPTYLPLQVSMCPTHLPVQLLVCQKKVDDGADLGC